MSGLMDSSDVYSKASMMALLSPEVSMMTCPALWAALQGCQAEL